MSDDGIKWAGDDRLRQREVRALERIADSVTRPVVSPPDSPEANGPSLRSFAQWIVSLDEPGSTERRTINMSQIIDAARDALAARPSAPAADTLREAAEEVVAAHRAVIEGVTPKHPNWCADDDDAYSSRFSRWHAASRALAVVLPSSEPADEKETT